MDATPADHRLATPPAPPAQAAWPAFGLAGPFGLAGHAWDYAIDAWQRSVLFLDVLRQRGNAHQEYAARTAPHVLSFAYEPVLDGRTLERPVNYWLVRILPPDGVAPDTRMRPFIVFDPRAGHGPGIGGMKHDSEIGVALKAGHPCYFVGFLPQPVPGQTIEDVCHAQARFIARVAELHPQADGKPCLVGNCQAGWQIAMTASIIGDSAGPLLLAGAPLSYWAGTHGKYPLRYLGGLLGGTWLTSLAGDLGHGVFDGAHLVANFEAMNPSNTYWHKNYHVYANIDTESARFLEFEKWWGSPVLLNAEEIQFIVDNLFVGNRLSSGDIFTSAGLRVDLRNIRSPIVVFCSWGDDITPPYQALDWITDIYATDAALIDGGQTIVYALHQSIGHLGIFVSAKVATKEHEEFARAMDMIDALPPGLYEAVFVPRDGTMANAELVSGDYLVRFERRSLADIRALGGNDAQDDARFATVARLSEVTQGVYRQFLGPWVRMATTEASADALRRLHPHRMRFAMFSDANPFLAPIATLAEAVRANRRPAAADNPFLAAQEAVSDGIIALLDQFKDLRDHAEETLFLNLYGLPSVQAALGLAADGAAARAHIGRDVAREAAQSADAQRLERQVGRGGMVEAVLRALLYVSQAYAQGAVDERGFAMLRQIRQQHPDSRDLGIARFKEIVREQSLLLRHDEAGAMAALPALLPPDPAGRQAGLDAVRRVSEAAGAPDADARFRLQRVAALFAPPAIAATKPREEAAPAA